MFSPTVSEISPHSTASSLDSVHASSGEHDIGEWELSVIELFVRAAQLIGVPRSVGQIYGLLFCRDEPMSMDGVMGALGISKGSASTGLKTLRQIGAVKTTFVIGDRRDHFAAELKLRKLVAGFINEQVQPHLDGGVERLEHLETLVGGLEEADQATARRRLEILRTWHSKMSRLTPIIRKML